MCEGAVQLTLSNFFPGAFSVLLRTPHTRCEVFEAVHMQPSTPVTWRQDALALSEAFHPVDHLDLEWAAVILFRWLTGTLTRSW